MRPGDLYESTHFVLDARGRIVSTREPTPAPGPLFSLTRSADRVAWSVHASVPDELARELERLARSEAPQPDAHAAPRWAERYLESLRGVLTSRSGELAVDHGPAFEFSARIEAPAGVTRLDDANLLLGAALIELGKPDEARAAFEAAKAAAPAGSHLGRIADLWLARLARGGTAPAAG